MSSSMKPKTYEAKILEVVEDTPSTKTLVVEMPDDFSFKPGQFVMVLMEINGNEERRAYSISSSPNQQGSIELTVKLEPNSKGGSIKLHQMKEGDPIKVMGPYGMFVMNDDVEHAVLIAASSGIAPFRSMWRYRLEQELGTTSIFMTAKSFDDLIFYDEIVGLEEDNEPILAYCTITQEPPEDWAGNKGRITLEILKDQSKDYNKSTFYLCGSPVFCEAMKHLLLKDGIHKDQVKMEKYW